MTDSHFDKLLRERLEHLAAEGTPRGWEPLADRLQADELGVPADEDFRETLGTLSATSEPDWGSFETQLDRSYDEADPFDLPLAAALGNLNVDATPDWETFSEQLDQNLDEPDALDLAVAAALGGLEAGQPSGWDQLSDRLDVLSDQELDGTVRERLDGYEVSQNAEHWPKMEEKLERTFSLRQRIRRWRLVEAALVALLLFSLFNTVDHNYRHVLPDLLEELNFGRDDDAPTDSEPIAANRIDEFTVSIRPAAPGTSESGVSDGTEVPVHSANAQSETGTEKRTYFVRVEPSNKEIDQKSLDPIEVASDIPGFRRSTEETPASNLTTVSEEEVPTASRKFRILPRLNTLFPKKLEEKKKAPRVKLQTSYEKPHLRLGMVALGEMQLVSFDPLDRELAEEFPTKYSQGYGYGGGLTLGFQYDRFEFETGMIYANRLYNPNHEGRFFGNFNRYVREALTQVNYETIEVPANLRLDAYRKRNWRIYGGVGISLNTVIQSSYTVQRKTYAFQIPDPIAPGTPATESKLAELPYPKGLLEGGQFWNNSYLSFNLTAGVEKYVSPRTSIYLQPVFQHSLRGRGYGPLQDRFEAFSLRFGTRVTVW